MDELERIRRQERIGHLKYIPITVFIFVAGIYGYSLLLKDSIIISGDYIDGVALTLWRFQFFLGLSVLVLFFVYLAYSLRFILSFVRAIGGRPKYSSLIVFTLSRVSVFYFFVVGFGLLEYYLRKNATVVNAWFDSFYVHPDEPAFIFILMGIGFVCFTVIGFVIGFLSEAYRGIRYNFDLDNQEVLRKHILQAMNED